MVSCPPRLRRDLACRQEQTAGGICVVIKHPGTRRFFRLEEAEYFIAQQLDGSTAFEEIRKRTEAKFDAELPLETLHAFIQTLNKNGLLETADALKRDARHKPKRFRGTPLYCRVQVCDPCEILKWLAGRTNFLFTKYFAALATVSIFLAVCVTAANWREFREDLPRLYHSSIASAIILIIFAVIVAHEFGHGLTCTHFGGEVHEMGFAMIFLMPAFYCNVSDAWLFPEKSKRLWVGFAGPYFELFLWSLAVFAWRLTEPTTWINFVALSVMATSAVHTMLNFNPLIKLDGYYLLSDYLELPNLRKRSFRQVGCFMERLFGFGSDEKDDEKLTPRERRIFWIYGAIALAGSFSILGYIVIGAGNTLVAGRTPTAVVITLMLLFMKFRRRFRRMFANPGGAAASFDDMDFDAQEEDEADEPALTGPAWYSDATGDEAGAMHEPAAMGNGEETDTAVVAADGESQPEAENDDDFASETNATMDTLLEAMYGRRIRAMRSVPSDVAAPPKARSAPFRSAPQGASGVEPPVAEDDQQVAQRAVLKDGKSPSAPRTQTGPPPSQQPARKQETQEKEEKNQGEPAGESEPARHAERERKGSHRGHRYVRRLVWLALAACGAVGLFYFHWEAQASGPLNILPVRNADVRTEIDGLVGQVLVREGSIVHKGDLVARLSVRENQAALEQTEGQIQQLNALLRLQVAGPTPAEIDVAKTAVVKAKDNLDFAKAKLDATKELFKNNLVARLELDTAEDLYATSKDDLADAEGKLRVLLNGTRPEQIDQTKAQISSLQAQRRFLEGQIRRTEIRSSVDGIVATPDLELKELVGQVVQKGALIAKVFELQKTTVEIAVPENEIPDVQVGQRVVLKVRAYPNETFSGQVSSIATSAFAPSTPAEGTLLPAPGPPAPSSNSAPKTILVTTEIDNHSRLLKPGMTGHAKVFCGRRRLIDLLNQRLARTVKVQFWSWW